MMQEQVGGEPSFFGILLGDLITLSFHLEILVDHSWGSRMIILSRITNRERKESLIPDHQDRDETKHIHLEYL